MKTIWVMNETNELNFAFSNCTVISVYIHIKSCHYAFEKIRELQLPPKPKELDIT